MQQEIDTLQNERKDLKEKIRQLTKKNLFDNLMSRQSSSSVATPSTPGVAPIGADDATANGKLANIYMNESPNALVQEVNIKLLFINLLKSNLKININVFF